MQAARFQYQQKAEPLQPDAAPVVVTLEWWQPPALVLRVRRIQADVGAITPLFETLPAPDLSWQGSYPVWLRPPVGLAARQQQPFAFYVEPFPSAQRLSAWACYPDFARRATLHPSRMPSYSFGTLDPIPNPPVTYVIEDRVLLGQNPSIEIATYPTLGGGQSWG